MDVRAKTSLTVWLPSRTVMFKDSRHSDIKLKLRFPLTRPAVVLIVVKSHYSPPKTLNIFTKSR